jgi:enoyl-CoA hydratase
MVIHLNRPDQLNSLGREMMHELSDVLSQIERDENLRAVILTGAGERAFSAGADITELAESVEAAALFETGQRLCDQVESFPVPVIAAINGIAAGGDFELALAAHIRIASHTATFSLQETKLGLIPADADTRRLAREVGQDRALEIMLTGRTITAREALDIGLVNQLANPDDLLNEAMAVAAEIAHLAPLAIRACLQAVTRGIELPLDEALALERELFASLFTTDDMREGTTAFLEKRIPVFTGR